MKNHFYIAYMGNKREEVDNFYNRINLKGINTIIEPFCGSCALSFYIASQQPKKYKYVLNDNNKFLLEMYNIIIDDTKLNEFDEKIKEIVKTIENNKENYNKICKDKDTNIISWFIANKFYAIRAGLFPLNKKIIYNSLKDYPIYEFFRNENITFTNDDALKTYNDYKDKKDALIIMDPPYLQTCNDFYLNKDVNIYEYLYNNDIKNEKARIYLILENMWIINLLFKRNKIIDEYSKTYQTSKKKTSHILITNH